MHKVGDFILVVLLFGHVVTLWWFLRRHSYISKLKLPDTVSVYSTPPSSALIPAEQSRFVTMAVAERDVVAATMPLLLTTEERVKLIQNAFIRTEKGLSFLPDPHPASLAEPAYEFNRQFFDWVAGDDPEISDEWWQAVTGTGRWER